MSKVNEEQVNEIGYTDLYLHGRHYKILGYPNMNKKSGNRTMLVPNKDQILVIDVGDKDAIPFAIKKKSTRNKNGGLPLAPFNFNSKVVQYLVDLNGNKHNLI